MHLSDVDKEYKLGFTGSYYSLTQGINSQKFDDQIFIPIFTLFLDDFPGMESYFLSLFLDVNFADENYVIPSMSTVDVFPSAVTEELLVQQQVGYKIKIGKKDQYRSQIESVIIPRFIYRDNDDGDGVTFGKVGLSPSWKLEDDTPPNGPEGSPNFICQISEDFMFRTISNAPRQKVIDYFSPDLTAFRAEPAYQIFAGNEVYVFLYSFNGNYVPFIVVQS